MTGLMVALSFLTRVPGGARVHSEDDLAAGVPWFPVVGAVVGGLVGVVYASTVFLLPPFLAAAVAVGAGVLLTGAFHEDGLADTADALGGGWTKEERLEIFKDPRHGTFGSIALVFSVLLRAGAIASFDWSFALLALPAAHAMSRGGAVALLGWLPPAADGLGATYGSAVTRGRAVFAACVGLLIGLICLGLWALPAALAVGLVVFEVGRVAGKKIDGVTGDVLGAAQQLGEIVVLIVAIVVA